MGKKKATKLTNVAFTKGELKAAIIACGNYHGSLQKHPRAQQAAWKAMQSVFLNSAIYG